MSDVNFTQAMTRIINNAVNNSSDNDTLVTVLSLTCLLSILNRNQAEGAQNIVQNTGSPTASNTLQKILSELTKGDDSGPSPDLLMSLLPLLNSPQIKSKINPSNMAAMFSLLNGLGGDKNDKPKNTNKVQNLNEHKEAKEEIDITPPAAVEPVPDIIEAERHEPEKKTSSHLNWKSNF